MLESVLPAARVMSVWGTECVHVASGAAWLHELLGVTRAPTERLLSLSSWFLKREPVSVCLACACGLECKHTALRGSLWPQLLIE